MNVQLSIMLIIKRIVLKLLNNPVWILFSICRAVFQLSSNVYWYNLGTNYVFICKLVCLVIMCKNNWQIYVRLCLAAIFIVRDIRPPHKCTQRNMCYKLLMILDGRNRLFAVTKVKGVLLVSVPSSSSKMTLTLILRRSSSSGQALKNYCTEEFFLHP